MNGTGTTSLVEAMQTDLSHDAQRVGDVGSSDVFTNQDDSRQTGLTQGELSQAIERAANAAENAYRLAMNSVERGDWKSASQHASRALEHMNQLIALSRVTPKEQA